MKNESVETYIDSLEEENAVTKPRDLLKAPVLVDEKPEYFSLLLKSINSNRRRLSFHKSVSENIRSEFEKSESIVENTVDKPVISKSNEAANYKDYIGRNRVSRRSISSLHIFFQHGNDTIDWKVGNNVNDSKKNPNFNNGKIINTFFHLLN